MNELLKENLHILSLYQNEVLVILKWCACIIFLLAIISINRNENRKNMRLLKVEYSSSQKKNKKYKIRKYYLNETTGRIKIIDEHTNKEVINKSNWD